MFLHGEQGIMLADANAKPGSPRCRLLWYLLFCRSFYVRHTQWWTEQCVTGKLMFTLNASCLQSQLVNIIMQPHRDYGQTKTDQQLMHVYVYVYDCKARVKQSQLDGAKWLWDEEVCSSSVKKSWNMTLSPHSQKKAKTSKTRVPQE